MKLFSKAHRLDELQERVEALEALLITYRDYNLAYIQDSPLPFITRSKVIEELEKQQ
jgi:hypothetical protein